MLRYYKLSSVTWMMKETYPGKPGLCSVSFFQRRASRTRKVPCPRPFLKQVKWGAWHPRRTRGRTWWETWERQEPINLKSLGFWRVLREKFELTVDSEDILLGVTDVSKGNGPTAPHAKKCVKKKAHLWTMSSQENLGLFPLVHLALWDPPVFLKEKKPGVGRPMNIVYARRNLLISLSLLYTRGHIQVWGPLKAEFVSKGACSLQIFGFTSGSTQARSHTAVIWAPRSSLASPCCLLMRGPTPRRSFPDKAFSHRGKLSVHWCTHSGLKPHMAPKCHSAFHQLGTSIYHQKSHSKWLTQDPALRSCPSAPRRKFKMISHLCGTKCEGRRRILEPSGVPFQTSVRIFEWWFTFPLEFVSYFAIDYAFMISFCSVLFFFPKKACLTGYQYFIMKLRLLLTVFLLGIISL